MKWLVLAGKNLLLAALFFLGAPGVAAQPVTNILPTLDQPIPVNSASAVPHQLLVRFRPKVGRERQRAVVKSVATAVKEFPKLNPPNALKQSNVDGANNSLFDQLVLIKLNEEADLAETIARLQQNPDVLYAEPNYHLRLADGVPSQPGPVRVPNDFELSKSWALHNTGQTGGTNGADIHAFEAWGLATGDKRIIVAVIDTGVDYFHPDLAANIWTNPKEIPGNGIDDDGNGYIDDVHGYDFISDDSDPLDDHGHGTHCSGIVGAVGDNQRGIAGICWQVSVMAIKAFDDAGNADVAAVLQGIRYAVANGATVINASWGNDDKSKAMEEAIIEADKAGVLFVAAAGNDHTDKLFYPAGFSEVLAVAATDHNDKRAIFSNFGAYVGVAAPGDFVYSTLPDDKYDYMSGTSMAAPFVSGLAALLLSKHPEFTNHDIRNIIRNTVDPIVTDNYIGTGRINAYKALLVDAPLPVARLNVPSILSGNTEITGAAVGNDFVNYSLAYGKGRYPTNWTEFYRSTAPVSNGVLYSGLPTSGLDEGGYTFRLVATGTSGQSEDQVFATVRNVSLNSPVYNDVLRAGEAVQIRGTVFGQGRTYTIEYGAGSQPSAWQTEGITLANGGKADVLNGILATWDTSQLKANAFYSLKLTAYSGDTVVGQDMAQMIFFDGHLQSGWPQYNPVQGEYPSEDWREFTVADLDNDGRQEIIIVAHGNSDGLPARLLVYNYDGTLKWSKDLAAGVPYSDTPLVGDIDRDGFKEIFVDVGEAGQFFAFRHDGTPLGGNWPLTLEVKGLGKVMADVDGDGYPEIVALAQMPDTEQGIGSRELLVIRRDGQILRKWSLPDCADSMDVPRILPAVANLDDDSDLEIAVVSGCRGLSVYDIKKMDGPVWTASCDTGEFFSSPVIGDLNGDGKNVIFIGAASPASNPEGGLYAFDSKGKRLPGWPVLPKESFPNSPALADINGDGRLEICVAAPDSHLLYMLQGNGFNIPGWPVGPIYRATLRSSPVIGDIDGDGHPDILMAAPGLWFLAQTSGDISYVGGIRAWSADGRSLSFNDNPALSVLPMESSAGNLWNKAAPAVLTDIDGDGKLDIVATSVYDTAYPPAGQQAFRKDRSGIYVWTLNTPFVPENMPWPMFQQNIQHTGYYRKPPKPDVAPTILQIPSQTIQRGGQFIPFALEQYVDDPDDRAVDLSWQISGYQELIVTIDKSGIVTVVPRDPNWLGSETLRFMVQDPQGLSSSISVVFEVREHYQPPVAAQDNVSTDEDTPIEIDPLANDSDPNGGVLSIATVSKPHSGTITRTAQQTLIYKPSKDFHGTDRFSYTVSNGQGGTALGTVVVEVASVNDAPLAELDQVITLEDQSVEIDVLANDTDPDGDPLTLVDFDQPSNGAVKMVEDGHLLYAPAPDFNGLDSFAYRIRDSFNLGSTGLVMIMVKPVNDPPRVADRSISLNRNSSVTVDFQALDADNDTLTFKLLKGPEHGALLAYPTVATYTPQKGYVGTDSFTYQANDGYVDSQIATVSFIVKDINNPPDVPDLNVTNKFDHPIELTFPALDADDDPLTFHILSLPQNGSLTGDGPAVTYHPNKGFIGIDSFTFQASDGKEPSRIANVTINVTDLNTAPIAQNLAIVMKVNTTTNIELPALDGEADALTFEFVTQPANGQITGAGPIVSYRPNPDFVGLDRFTFKASDSELTSDLGMVSITIAPLNDPPVVQDQSVAVNVNTPTPIQLDVMDPNGDFLNCPILKGPKNGRLSGTGTNFVYIPKTGFSGADSFTYKVWDGTTYSKEAKVYITVSLPGSNPTVAFRQISFVQGGQVQLVLKGDVGKTISIETSTNLIDWMPLSSVKAESGTVTVVDTNAPAVQSRFYRATQF